MIKICPRTIRNSLKITLIVLLSILFFLAVVVLFLQNRKIQTFIAQIATAELSTLLETKVEIGSLEYKFFNAIEVNNIYIEDQQKDTLLHIEKLDAYFDFWGFFRKEIRIREAQFHHLTAHIATDSVGRSNFAFIVDRLSSQEKKPFTLEIQLNEITLHNSTLHYRDALAKPQPKDIFSTAELLVTNLNSSLALHMLTADSLNAEIKSLSFQEQSGFTVSQLQAHVVANHQGATAPKAYLRMPNSEIDIDTIRIGYEWKDKTLSFAQNIEVDLPIRRSKIGLADLGPFVPMLKDNRGYAEFSAHILGTIGNLEAKEIWVNYDRHQLLRGSISFMGLPNIHETYIYGNIDELNLNKAEIQDFLSDLQNKAVVLPVEVSRLGNMRYTGNVSGFLTNLVAYGALTTKLGTITTDVLLRSENELKDIHLSGKVKTTNFRLGELLANKSVGNISFSVETNTIKKANKPLTANLLAQIENFTFREYNYDKINIDGHYHSDGFTGHFDINDPNVICTFDGTVDFSQKLPVFNFNLDIDRFAPHKLHLTKEYEELSLALNTNFNVVGNSLDNANGTILIDSIFLWNKGDSLAIDNIQLQSKVTQEFSSFKVISGLINAHFWGNYRYSNLGLSLQQLTANYLPSFFSASQLEFLQNSPANNEIEFYLYLKELNPLCSILDLPLSFDGITTLKGFMSDANKSVGVQMALESATVGAMELNDITFNLDNKSDVLKLSTFIKNGDNPNGVACLTKVSAINDSIVTQINWANSDSVTHKGNVQFITNISQYNKQPLVHLRFFPTEVIISDSIWNLEQSEIIYTRADSILTINDFKFGNKTQYVHIDGIAGHAQSDSVHVKLSDVRLDYILQFTKLSNTISFNGQATGEGKFYSLLSHPIFDINVLLKNGQINDAVIGDVAATASWNKENNSIDIKGVVSEQADMVAKVDGTVLLEKDSLLLAINSSGLRLRFLDKWLGSVVQEIDGRVFGMVNVGVKLKEGGVDIHGKPLVRNGSLRLDILGTKYSFSDSILLERERVSIKKIALHDKDGNKAYFSGVLNHNGQFQELNYQFDIDCQNILGMETQMADNDLFFGKVYATGRVVVAGTDKETRIVVNARTMPKTNFNISIGSSSVAADNAFITFVSPAAKAAEEKETKPTTKNNNLKITLHIEATPDAALQLIIDPKTGDVITGKGAGNLTLEFATNGDVKMFGTYILESGTYVFTLQNVFRREFKLLNGSSVSWTGDVYNAQVDINGVYSVTASLRDLMDEEQLKSLSRQSVPVNCLLHLTDELMSPTIKLNIDLPNSDENVKQQVRNIINTDEMMMRQVLFLLMLGKFSTPEMQASTAYSLLSSTVTSQVNSWISKLTTDFSFGFNVRSSGEGAESTQEYETEFLYQPNSRLIINGNLGYRDDNVSQNKTIFDFDLEYLLNKSGKFRAKAYTHTVDRLSSLKTGQTVQGVGVMYKEDFNTVGELFNYYLDTFKRIFTKKKGEVEEKSEP